MKHWEDSKKIYLVLYVLNVLNEFKYELYPLNVTLFEV